MPPWYVAPVQEYVGHCWSVDSEAMLQCPLPDESVETSISCLTVNSEVL